MPIRLNLLAEAQAAEEARRRDPAKRAAWVGMSLACLMLAYSSCLQLRVSQARSELSRVEIQLGARTNEYPSRSLENQRKATEAKGKLAMLRELATNRFLSGTLLNALQQATAEDVQLVRFRVEQTYAFIAEVKAKTNGDMRIIPGKPARSSEKIKLTFDAADSSANPGDQVNRFKEVVGNNGYLRSLLAKTNALTLKNLSAPQVVPATGKPCVLFTLEGNCQEQTR